MSSRSSLSLNKLVDVLKASAETTRMRLLVLLSSGDLTVSDLTDILGQSQPRISRHLKLLTEAGLIERYQEGAWAWFRLRREGDAAQLARRIVEEASSGDAVIARDQSRLGQVRAARADKAMAYFSRNAQSWDNLRRLHVSEAEVESALRDMIGDRPVDSLLDLGTGTGRLLQLFEGIYRHGMGIDASREMLAMARSNLEKSGISKASIRLGDIFNLPLEGGGFDLVTIHQVLHYLDEPQFAINEAARMLRPGGRLLIVDFAPHGIDALRIEHHHARLGFSRETMAGWLKAAGLEVIETRDLQPEKGEEALTVTIWLARDRRMEIADDSTLKIASRRA
jgi:ubiquinone/menaquinone biosynthesis C-methylase UbiE/DNA-binding transcriptional ArsR family regulator